MTRRLFCYIEYNKINNNGPNIPENFDLLEIGAVLYVDDEEEDTYSIVGSLEADPFENKISNESPIGRAIMNKKVGLNSD